MRTHWSTVAGLILEFCVFLSSNSIMPKRGNCPKVFNPFVPGKACRFDRDCECDDKCYVYSYGAVCAPPVSTTLGCLINVNQMPIYDKDCYSDSDCRFGEKCCATWCGHLCMSSKPMKPGECPDYVWRTRCFDHCQNDDDCSNELKCCPSNCGLSCVSPTVPSVPNS
nr:WAP four-disulfide core domain protein 2-like [Nothobranchius furzeri]